MAIPSQDQLMEYLNQEANQPMMDSQDATIEPLDNSFKTNLLTSSNARKMTKKNILELERLSGHNFGITV